MTIAEKLVKVAENVPKVYEAGTEAMILKVTDMVTDNNTRTNYGVVFSYANWNDFKFAYTIKPTGSIAQMFYNSPNLEVLPTPIDLGEILTSVTDSNTYRRGVFGYCRKLKEIDLSAETGMNMRAIGGLEEWFPFCQKLETIKGLNIHEGTVFSASTFQACESLVNLSFAEGSVIGQSLDIHWSRRLSMLSLASIVRTLSKTATGQSITLPTTARDTYDSATISGSWDNLVAQYPNWSFKYS